jgi:hypothetical protein
MSDIARQAFRQQRFMTANHKKKQGFILLLMSSLIDEI